MPVICWDFMGNLPFTGNLQEVSGLLYPTSTAFSYGEGIWLPIEYMFGKIEIVWPK